MGGGGEPPPEPKHEAPEVAPVESTPPEPEKPVELDEPLESAAKPAPEPVTEPVPVIVPTDPVGHNVGKGREVPARSNPKSNGHPKKVETQPLLPPESYVDEDGPPCCTIL